MKIKSKEFAMLIGLIVIVSLAVVYASNNVDAVRRVLR